MTTVSAPNAPTPTKSRQVFFSKIPNLRIVRERGNEAISPTGGITRTAFSLVYQFGNDNGGNDHPNYLVVDDDLRARDEQFFNDHADQMGLKPDTRPAEEWLRDHKMFDAPEGLGGFVEILPVAPDPSQVLSDVAMLAAEQDEETLLKVYEAEQGNWRRPEVLGTIERALDHLRGEFKEPEEPEAE